MWSSRVCRNHTINSEVLAFVIRTAEGYDCSLGRCQDLNHMFLEDFSRGYREVPMPLWNSRCRGPAVEVIHPFPMSAGIPDVEGQPRMLCTRASTTERSADVFPAPDCSPHSMWYQVCTISPAAPFASPAAVRTTWLLKNTYIYMIQLRGVIGEAPGGWIVRRSHCS